MNNISKILLGIVLIIFYYIYLKIKEAEKKYNAAVDSLKEGVEQVKEDILNTPNYIYEGGLTYYESPEQRAAAKQGAIGANPYLNVSLETAKVLTKPETVQSGINVQPLSPIVNAINKFLGR